MNQLGSDLDPGAQVARGMWRALEPYHTVTYFAPESREATTRLGCRGGWMSYFALRAAPLGPVAAEVVTATFYSFHPGRVSRAIPAAWHAAAPSALLAARLESVDAALRRLLGSDAASPSLAEAAGLARVAALAASTAGRPLAAANAALTWPEEPHLALWHAQTLLRESRGDGHIAALVSAQLDPCEALVLFAAQGQASADGLRQARGWSESEWAAAAERLTGGGLLDSSGALTPRGSALRRWVEDRTDLSISPAWSALGAERRERLVELAAPLVARIVANGGFQVGNPMGLEPLAEATSGS